MNVKYRSSRGVRRTGVTLLPEIDKLVRHVHHHSLALRNDIDSQNDLVKNSSSEKCREERWNIMRYSTVIPGATSSISRYPDFINSLYIYLYPLDTFLIHYSIMITTRSYIYNHRPEKKKKEIRKQCQKNLVDNRRILEHQPGNLHGCSLPRLHRHSQ